MSVALKFVVIAIFQVGVLTLSVRIVTNPRQSPFKIGSRVEFTCEINPILNEQLNYKWRTVEYYYGGSSYSQQSFNTTFSSSTLRYCWYFCSVLRNGTVLGSANKLVEVHGLLNTNDSITRTFVQNDNIILQINDLTMGSYGYLASYIHSLKWYHNGTEITNSTRVSIARSGTSLSISDMINSDAGKYEVKIGSIDYYGYGSSSSCDRSFLPALELLAVNAPVTFIVQQHYTPKYNPEDIIQVFTLESIYNNLIINSSIEIDLSLISYGIWYKNFYKNGITQSLNSRHFNFTQTYSSEIMLLSQISYNETKDVVGNYIYAEYTLDFDIRRICRSYYYYIDDLYIYFIPIFILYWNLQEKEPYVILRINYLESTHIPVRVVECDIIDGRPDTLSLRHYNELLVEVYDTHLNYTIPTGQFGTFTCQTSIGSNSSLVRERGTFQSLMNVCCIEIKDLQTALSDVMNNLCEDCNITVSNFNNTITNYSISAEQTFFTTDFIYSNSRGTVTSTTLIHHFQSWILSQRAPNLTLAGKVASINKDCPVTINKVTTRACLKVLQEESSNMFGRIPNTVISSISTATASVSKTSFNSIGGISLAAGILFGVFIATITIIIIKYIKRKCKNFSEQTNENELTATTKCQDIPMDSNTAYETVDVHYADPRYGTRQPMDTEECIYEQPAI